MRKKCVGGGRPRFVELHPQPSTMALNYLTQADGSKAHLDCSHGDNGVNEANGDTLCSTVPEMSDHGGKCHIMARKTTGEMVLAEKSRGKGPEGIHGLEDSSEIDWTEKDVCVKCDKGGKLLICSDPNCPLAIHEECMHCSARFDSMGNFYCPYCSYKQAMLETRKSRKKAMLAKKALSFFLDKGLQKASEVREKERNPPSVGVVDEDTRYRLHNEVHNRSDRIQENQWKERSRSECTASVIPDESTRASALNEQNDLLGRCEDNARYGGASCREEERECGIEIIHVGESAREDHDDSRDARVVQHEEQASLEGEQSKLDVAREKSMDGKLDDAGIGKEDEGRSREEEEEMQELGLEPIVSSRGDGSMEQNNAVASASFCTDSEDVSQSWRRTRKMNQNGQSLNVEHSISKQSVRKSFLELNGNQVHKEKSVAREKSTEDKLDNAVIVKEDEGRSQEDEEMQEQGQEPVVSSSGEGTMEQDNVVASDSSRGDSEDVSPSWRRTRKKNQNGQSSNVERSKQSARKSLLELNGNLVHKEKGRRKSKSRQQITNTAFPNVKRKRQLWTTEEEEMLKEGVEKFSTTVNKNLPWRKILDFGCHVFDGTRTPVDLKDKWRNLLKK